MENAIIISRTSPPNKSGFEPCIKEQIFICTRYTKNNNMRIKKIFRSHSISGFNENYNNFEDIPEIIECINYIKNNNIKVILVSTFDRISYNAIFVFNFVEKIKKLKIRLISVLDNINTDVPNYMFIIGCKWMRRFEIKSGDIKIKEMRNEIKSKDKIIKRLKLEIKKLNRS